VDFQGVNHCAIGSARLSLSEEGLKAQSGGATGQDGVAINLGLTSNWTAGTFSESKGDQKTVLTSVSEGSPTSTATITTKGETASYSATFTGSGEQSTYSLLVYNRGVLQAAVGGLQGGVISAQAIPGGNWTPSCRPLGQSYNSCLSSCYSHGYPNCNYCSVPCRNTFHVTPRGACQWRFDVPAQRVQLSSGQVVAADEIVMNEEVQGASSYPYLGFDQILIQSTAASTTITSESTTAVCK
jgi:hypothetical protein